MYASLRKYNEDFLSAGYAEGFILQIGLAIEKGEREKKEEVSRVGKIAFMAFLNSSVVLTTRSFASLLCSLQASSNESNTVSTRYPAPGMMETRDLASSRRNLSEAFWGVDLVSERR